VNEGHLNVLKYLHGAMEGIRVVNHKTWFASAKHPHIREWLKRNNCPTQSNVQNLMCVEGSSAHDIIRDMIGTTTRPLRGKVMNLAKH